MACGWAGFLASNMPGPTGGARHRQVNVEQGNVGDDPGQVLPAWCTRGGYAASGMVAADLANVGATNSSQVGASGGPARSPVIVGGGIMNDPVAATSDGRGVAARLGAIPAMRRAVLMDVFATMDAGDLDAMVAHMTDDVSTQFGNQPQVCGKTAFRALFEQVGQIIKGLRHEVLDLFHAVEDFDVWVVRLSVSYQLLDGTTVTLPCCNVFRMCGDLISEYRVYMDIGPVLSGAAAHGV
jgi:ketosteroid isomerase-like protein